MKSRLRYYLIACLVHISLWLCGQTYDAPTLCCIKRINNTTNTLDWRVPIVTCGAFQKYYIYYATSPTGPYSLIDSIDNEMTTRYTHVNAAGSPAICYYYLTSKYSCPSSYTSTSSLIFSNEPMPRVQLNAISIENNHPVYRWSPVVNRPEVYGYIIAILGGRVVAYIPSKDTTSYTDTSFDASTGYYQGGIASRDSCDDPSYRLNRSGAFEQRTSFLSLANNPCNNSINLSWTPYVGWTVTDEVKEYQILVTKNSAAETIVNTNDPSTLAYIYSDFVYGDTLTIRIRAIHPTDPNIYSHSNSYSFIAKKSQEPSLFQGLSASYVNNYQVKVSWYCDPSTRPKSFHLSQIRLGNHQLIRKISKIPFYTDGSGFYYAFDDMGNKNAQTYYLIEMEDSCNNTYQGVPVRTNFLSLTQVGLYRNDLRWIEKLFPDSIAYTTIDRTLYFSIDGYNYTMLSQMTSGELEYRHDISNYKNSNGHFCYKLLVRYRFDTTPPIRDTIHEVYSQTECIDMRTVLWMPNAFKVGGYTPEYKPLIVFHTSNDFSMKIFNRWGEQIFESKDPLLGWNGVMRNGTNAPEGSYMYKVDYMGNDGVKVTKTGNFALFR